MSSVWQYFLKKFLFQPFYDSFQPFYESFTWARHIDADEVFAFSSVHASGIHPYLVLAHQSFFYFFRCLVYRRAVYPCQIGAFHAHYGQMWQGFSHVL